MGGVRDALQHVHEPSYLVRFYPARHAVTATDPRLQQEARTHCVPHGLEHGEREPSPVLEAAPVLIVPLVPKRRQELGEQPAVTGM